MTGWQPVLRIAAQVAEGLQAAHEQGLVHRDIKPANVLLENGVERVQITDFGLARAIDDASMTRSGVIAGTPQYMSPEQAHGDSVDHRSDLFSLGSLIYFMLTGRSPFRAETTMGVLNRIGNDEPRRIRGINAEVPQWLEQIVIKLLSKSPDDRFQTAAEVAELLQDWHAHLQQPDMVQRPSEPTAPAAGPRPKNVPEASASGSRRGLTKWLIATAAFAFFAFAGVLIVLELNKGTLTIESEADNVPIRIMKGDEVYRRMTVRQGGDKTRITAGEYVVEIDGDHDRVEVDGGRVSLSRGETVLVTIVENSPTSDNAIAAPSVMRSSVRELRGIVTGMQPRGLVRASITLTRKDSAAQATTIPMLKDGEFESGRLEVGWYRWTYAGYKPDSQHVGYRDPGTPDYIIHGEVYIPEDIAPKDLLIAIPPPFSNELKLNGEDENMPPALDRSQKAKTGHQAADEALGVATTWLSAALAGDMDGAPVLAGNRSALDSDIRNFASLLPAEETIIDEMWIDDADDTKKAIVVSAPIALLQKPGRRQDTGQLVLTLRKLAVVGNQLQWVVEDIDFEIGSVETERSRFQKNHPQFATFELSIVVPRAGKLHQTVLDEAAQSALFESRLSGPYGFLTVQKAASIDDVVAAFNLLTQENDLGRHQSKLTADEVIGAFRKWIGQKECKPETRDEFQKIIDTRTLIPGQQFVFNDRFVSEDHVFDVWEVKFGNEDSYPWFKIRETVLLSRPKSEREKELWAQSKEAMAESFRDFKRGTTQYRSTEEQQEHGNLLEEVYRSSASTPSENAPPTAKAGFPAPEVLQEMHDLSAETTRLSVKLRYHEQFLEGGSKFNGTESSQYVEALRDKERILARAAEITDRLDTIHEKELGVLQKVADEAVLECSEEPLYGQPSYGVIVYAQTLVPIRKDELLLFHACGLYRSRGTLRPLNTTGAGFYVRPQSGISSGSAIALACIQDAEKEQENFANGSMPDSNRARDPSRAYRANVFDRKSGEPVAPQVSDDERGRK